MNNILNKIIPILSEFAPFIICGALFIWMCLLFWFIYHRQEEKKLNEFVNSDVQRMLDDEAERHEVKKGIPMLDIEKFVYESLGIEKNQTLIWLIRAAVVFGIAMLGFALKMLAIFIAFEIIMILKTNVEDKKLEDEIGVSRTELINKFLDFYIPSVQSGTSVRQTMQNFIAQYGDEEIVEYYYSTDPNKKVPFKWGEVIEVYNNGVDSEEQGLPDKASLKQDEVDRMMVYFNAYKQKLGEVSSICWCYYIGVPVVSWMSYSNYTETWNGWLGGVIVVILIIFFAMFNRMVQKKKTDCCDQIF